MRLSDLVRMAKEAGVEDPEVEIYEEELPHWETCRPEAPRFRDGKMFLASDSRQSTASFNDGGAANPFAPENRR